MGLDCSHDAFSGSYGAFNRLRQIVAAATGGSFPPHKDRTLDDRLIYFSGEGESQDDHPGLYEFLVHSDCDGDISPAMCIKVANELEALMPKVRELEASSRFAAGHILRDGGYARVLEKFIAGCRLAAANNEPLEFA